MILHLSKRKQGKLLNSIKMSSEKSARFIWLNLNKSGGKTWSNLNRINSSETTSAAKNTSLDNKQQTVVLQTHYQAHMSNRSEVECLNCKNMTEMLEQQFETDRLKLTLTQTIMWLMGYQDWSLLYHSIKSTTQQVMNSTLIMLGCQLEQIVICSGSSRIKKRFSKV
jgi:hypothetical protein